MTPDTSTQRMVIAAEKTAPAIAAPLASKLTSV